jgi:hypothetical protein
LVTSWSPDVEMIPPKQHLLGLVGLYRAIVPQASAESVIA